MTDTKKPDRAGRGNPANVVAFGQAARELRRRSARRPDPLPHEPRGNPPTPAAKYASSPPNWTPNDLGLPNEDACPVEPVGIQGGAYHVIDSTRQFRTLVASDFSHAGIQSLFSATPNYPAWAWPRHGKVRKDEDDKPLPPPIESFKDDQVRQALFLACARKGLFDPDTKMRGRGAWLLRGGQLVYHAGEELWAIEDGRFRELPIGLIGEHLYPRLAPLPAPWTEPMPAGESAAASLFQTLCCWNWKRPIIDPLLLLGWIGVAFLGGALGWRPCVLLLGDKGTGKSTLQDGLKAIFGDALLASADTTAAGIYQSLSRDTRPVAVDELEPGDHQAKVDAVVDLMRAASSGNFARRGSADSKNPVAFQMRSAFLFSAINNPMHDAADLSRVAVLRLQPLNLDQAPPAPIDAETCGPMILATLMREFHRFDAILKAYKQILASGDHPPRGQETYGTLLACAELMLTGADTAALGLRLSEEPEFWQEHLSADALPEVELSKPNWRKCVESLLTQQVNTWRGGRRSTVGQSLQALERGGSTPVEGSYSFDEAERDLADTGLGLLRADQVKDLPADEGFVLAVPNEHPLVQELFRGTPWASGGWMDALRQCPHPNVMIHDKHRNSRRIGGVAKRCTLIVMKRFHEAPER